MRWTAISGSWRKTSDEVRKDVEEVVRGILEEGGGIVTGGALGVDYIATQVVLEKGDARKQLRIYLPITLQDFCAHYRKRAKEGVISEAQAGEITTQLEQVHKLAPNAIIDETPYTEANIESYYARNTSIIRDCDTLYAFRVNNSQGTQDAIDKARQLEKEVIVKNYTIQ